jgi:hypothetical protein
VSRGVRGVGAFGRPMGLVGRKSLKKPRRPRGQCRDCYGAGLSYRFSRMVCANCRDGAR